MRFQRLPRLAWSSTAAGGVLVFGCLSLLAQSRPPASQSRPVAPPAQRAAARTPAAPAGTPIRVLFLGTDEETPHNPSKMFPLLAAPLARRGIQLTYGGTPTETLEAAKLGYYDAVMIYGDRVSLNATQQQALDAFHDHRAIARRRLRERFFPRRKRLKSLDDGVRRLRDLGGELGSALRLQACPHQRQITDAMKSHDAMTRADERVERLLLRRVQ